MLFYSSYLRLLIYRYIVATTGYVCAIVELKSLNFQSRISQSNGLL